MTYIKCSSAAFKKYIPYHVISTYSCPWLKKCRMIFYWIKDVCLRSKTYLWNSSGSFPSTPWFSWSICTVYLEPERSLPSLTVQTPIHEHKAFHDLPSLFSHLTSLQPSWPSLFLHHGCFKVTETVSPVWSHFPSDLCRAGLLSLFKSYFKFTSSDQPSLAILFPPTQLFYMFLIYFLHGSY